MFRDRIDAAESLARRLSAWRGRENAVILAIPRGGLAVGGVLSRELDLPLDVVLAKKIGYPGSPEYAIGVVDLSSEALDEEALEKAAIPRAYIAGEISRLRVLLRRREELFHKNIPPLPILGKAVLVVDDGMATGSTMAAALGIARREGAREIAAAVPVGPSSAVSAAAALADEVFCLETPGDFFAIGQYYARFDQVEEKDAAGILRESRQEWLSRRAPAG